MCAVVSGPTFEQAPFEALNEIKQVLWKRDSGCSLLKYYLEGVIQDN